MKNQKNNVIFFLVAIIIILVLFIGVQTLRSRIASQQEAVYLQGAKDGQLLEQRNIINGIITYGYHVINVIDENNETQQIALGIMQQNQEQVVQS
tara:strand:- start:2039 stop:2323 length:285 start_codon:yes stop_codon:yes gene_type:complete